jgi:protein-S-isoprenylcysteine O-methyltransferase Ste14
VFLGTLRLLFLVYVLALCALAISDPSFERGGALLLVTLGIVGMMWQMDGCSVPVERHAEEQHRDEVDAPNNTEGV